jgi:hypothetical protein
MVLGRGEQKTEKLIKPKKQKKITKKAESWKKLIIIFFKIFCSIRFQFNKFETKKKTKPTGSVKKVL